jgi:hypothetical protein
MVVEEERRVVPGTLLSSASHSGISHRELFYLFQHHIQPQGTLLLSPASDSGISHRELFY